MFKAIDKWLPGYLASLARRPRSAKGLRHVFFAICDHYEPLGPGDRLGLAYGRTCVKRWREGYPERFAGFADADGRPPQHTFFYPEDQYDEELVESLATLCDAGFGEIEIHLHHRDDTAATLHHKLADYRDRLRERHGLLGENLFSGGDQHGEKRLPGYAFIHGNWAICNSRPDGDWCGVDHEVRVLLDTGCYVDMTMPSAPSPTQARRVNHIYQVLGDAGRRGHDGGTPLRVGGGQAAANDRLVFLPGPLALNFTSRKWGLLPRIENADLTGANPPTPARFALWLKQAVGVVGKSDWVFIKLHTHGCLPKNVDLLLGTVMQDFHGWLQQACARDERLVLHYLTARELYNVAMAAEAGADDWSSDLRDYVVGPPPRK